VHGTVDLRRVIVVKTNRDFKVWNLRAADAALEREDEEPARPGDFYYVRVVQEDEHHAWSSPIWLA
jgi:hypothetical protein